MSEAASTKAKCARASRMNACAETCKTTLRIVPGRQIVVIRRWGGLGKHQLCHRHLVVLLNIQSTSP